jgi:hypothetical protein
MRRPLAILFGSLFQLAAVLGPVRANEVPYFVTINGRPLDALHPGARAREGRLFINVVRAVRAFNGLLTFAPGGETRVTVGQHTMIYHVGKASADIDDESQPLSAAPFVENGDTFVPLASFADFVSATVKVDRDHHRVDLAVSSATKS